MKSRFLILTLLLVLTIQIFSCSAAGAAQQDNVNYIIDRIRITLKDSIDADNWQARYQLVEKNIQDLQKTLAYGGKLNENPVRKHYKLLAYMLDERKREYELYCATQEKLMKMRAEEAKGAVLDVGVEMAKRLMSPVPGYTEPVSAASTKNAEIIKQDFARLKTYDEAIKKIEQYKKSIIPSIHAIRDRKHGMEPLVKQFDALLGAAKPQASPAPAEASIDIRSFVWFGAFRGDSNGSLGFNISGNSVTGTFIQTEYSKKGDRMVAWAVFSGTIADNGTITATVINPKNNKAIGTFTGVINGGPVQGCSGSGNWTAKTAKGAFQGSWEVSK